jgi:peptidoglycan/LPS O-acetylase OafA/YrhL
MGASSTPSAPGVRPSSGPRLSGIEGLRAVAACSILAYHTWLYSPPGNAHAGLGRRLDHLMPNLMYGVVLFFTLSGFLLYRPFAASIVRGQHLPGVRRYLRNRALRILPAYWAILIFCAVVLGTVLFRDASHELVNGRLTDPGLLLQSALFVQNYDPNTVLTGIGPAWTLAIEAVFYVALPLLVLFAFVLGRDRATRSGRRWAALAPAGLLLVLGLTGKAVAAFAVPPSAPFDGWAANWHSVIERSFLCHADLFAFGMALAVIRIDSEDGLLRLPLWWRRAALVGCVVLAFLIVRYGEGQLSYSPWNTLVAVVCACVLALVVLPTEGARRPLLLRFLESRPFVLAGVVSYSIFLWHEPLIRWLHGHGMTLGGAGGFVVNLALIAAVTGVASTLTYRFVEAPALRLRFRTKHEPSPVAISASDAQAAP